MVRGTYALLAICECINKVAHSKWFTADFRPNTFHMLWKRMHSKDVQHIFQCLQQGLHDECFDRVHLCSGTCTTSISNIKFSILVCCFRGKEVWLCCLFCNLSPVRKSLRERHRRMQLNANKAWTWMETLDYLHDGNNVMKKTWLWKQSLTPGLHRERKCHRLAELQLCSVLGATSSLCRGVSEKLQDNARITQSSTCLQTCFSPCPVFSDVIVMGGVSFFSCMFEISFKTVWMSTWVLHHYLIYFQLRPDPRSSSRVWLPSSLVSSLWMLK